MEASRAMIAVTCVLMAVFLVSVVLCTVHVNDMATCPPPLLQLPLIGRAGIPHMLWVTGPYESASALPHELGSALSSWQSSPRAPADLCVHWFNNADCKQFISAVYPQYLEDYTAVLPGAFKADLWRLLILHRFGGVYADCGSILVTDSLWDELSATDLLLVDDHHVTAPGSIFQGILAATPSHPVIAAMVDRVIANIRKRHYGDSPVDVTGPVAIGPAVLDVVPWKVAKVMMVGERPKKTGRLHMAHWKAGKYVLPALGRVRVLDYRQRQVFDENNQVVVQCKSRNYYRIMYNKDTLPHYRHLWSSKLVYIEDLQRKLLLIRETQLIKT